MKKYYVKENFTQKQLKAGSEKIKTKNFKKLQKTLK